MSDELQELKRMQKKVEEAEQEKVELTGTLSTLRQRLKDDFDLTEDQVEEYLENKSGELADLEAEIKEKMEELRGYGL